MSDIIKVKKKISFKKLLNLIKVFFVTFMALIFPVIWLFERTSLKFGVLIGSIATLIGAILKCIVKKELWIRFLIRIFAWKFSKPQFLRKILRLTFFYYINRLSGFTINWTSFWCYREFMFLCYGWFGLSCLVSRIWAQYRFGNLCRKRFLNII